MYSFNFKSVFKLYVNKNMNGLYYLAIVVSIVIIIFVIWLLFRGGSVNIDKQKLNEACNETSDCNPGLICDTGTGTTGVCKVASGGVCSVNSQCSSGLVCRDGICKPASGGEGEPCPCGEGLSCVNKVCIHTKDLIKTVVETRKCYDNCNCGNCSRDDHSCDNNSYEKYFYDSSDSYSVSSSNSGCSRSSESSNTDCFSSKSSKSSNTDSSRSSSSKSSNTDSSRSSSSKSSKSSNSSKSSKSSNTDSSGSKSSNTDCSSSISSTFPFSS